MKTFSKKQLKKLMVEDPDLCIDLILKQTSTIKELNCMVNELHDIIEMYKARLVLTLRDPDEPKH